MLLSKEVEVSVLNNNRNYLEKSGYDISQDKVLIKIEDLSTGSKKEVLVQCDVCQNVKSLSYYNYNKSLNKFGIYCCSSSCSTIKKKKTYIYQNQITIGLLAIKDIIDLNTIKKS